MPTVSFDTPITYDEQDAAAASAADVAYPRQPEQTAVAVAGSKSLTTTAEGEKLDLALPKLQLVNKVGKLSDEYSKHVGEFLLDEVPTNKSTLQVIILGATRGYEENVEFEDQRLPLRFATLGDARAAGFRHVDEGPSERQVIDVALVYLLVCGAAGEYDLEFDGIEGSFGLAQLAVRKGGFKDVYVPYNTARAMGHLRKDQLAAYWDLIVVKKAYNGNTWYSPKLRKTTAKPTDLLKDTIRAEFEVLIGH